MIFVKIHKSYRDVVAVCDAEIVGKTFEEGIKQLEARESFYKGKEVSYQEAVKIMKDFSKEDATFNIIGENSVKAALELKIITKEGVKKVQNIPFALVLI